jgi:iron complex outermembrane receptor protein
VLNASCAYTNASYDKYIDPLGNDLTDQPFQNQPKFVYTLSGTYTIPTNFGDYKGRLDWYWRSSANLFPGGTAPSAFDIQPAYGLLNGRLSVHFDQQKLELSVWGRNLLNQRYIDVVFDQTSSYGYSNTKPGVPRTYGIELTKSF